jgi:hypothetical protein
MATSIENAVLSMKPRLFEGISSEKTRNVSLVQSAGLRSIEAEKEGTFFRILDMLS